MKRLHAKLPKFGTGLPSFRRNKIAFTNLVLELRPLVSSVGFVDVVDSMSDKSFHTTRRKNTTGSPVKRSIYR